MCVATLVGGPWSAVPSLLSSCLSVDSVNVLPGGCQGAAAAAIVLAPPRTALATPRPNPLSAAVAQYSAGALPPFPLLPAGMTASTSAASVSLLSRPVVAAQRPALSTLSVMQSQRWMIF